MYLPKDARSLLGIVLCDHDAKSAKTISQWLDNSPIPLPQVFVRPEMRKHDPRAMHHPTDCKICLMLHVVR
jgi:hypothetical protein